MGGIGIIWRIASLVSPVNFPLVIRSRASVNGCGCIIDGGSWTERIGIGYYGYSSGYTIIDHHVDGIACCRITLGTRQIGGKYASNHISIHRIIDKG
jgi:hypothetical protein